MLAKQADKPTIAALTAVEAVKDYCITSVLGGGGSSECKRTLIWWRSLGEGRKKKGKITVSGKCLFLPQHCTA